MSPAPNHGLFDDGLDCFVGRLRARLKAGAKTYGNTSFTRSAADLVDEIQQEIEDVAGWGLLLWIRLERLRGAVERVEPPGGRDG